jgi:hypothetical protein
VQAFDGDNKNMYVMTNNRKKKGILKVNGSGEKAEKHFFDKE